MTNIIVTLFEDYAGRTKREQCTSPAELIDLIKSTAAASKDVLPWIKMARFGD
jgi:hypothetical protein